MKMRLFSFLAAYFIVVLLELAIGGAESARVVEKASLDAWQALRVATGNEWSSDPTIKKFKTKCYSNPCGEYRKSGKLWPNCGTRDGNRLNPRVECQKSGSKYLISAAYLHGNNLVGELPAGSLVTLFDVGLKHLDVSENEGLEIVAAVGAPEYEEYEGDGDDTATGDVTMLCGLCAAPASSEYEGEYEYESDTSSDSSFSPSVSCNLGTNATEALCAQDKSDAEYENIEEYEWNEYEPKLPSLEEYELPNEYEEYEQGAPDNRTLEAMYVDSLSKIWHDFNGIYWEDSSAFLKTGWTNRSTSVCKWLRIRCDGNGTIVAIDLRIFNVSGGTFAAFVDALEDGGIASSLQELRLSSNPLKRGPFPASLASFRELHTLEIEGISIEGEIPADARATMAQHLVHFNAAGCSIKGPLPPFRRLIMGIMDANAFSGPIPASLGEHCHMLSELNLLDSDLSGEVPTGLWPPRAGLRKLVLAGNDLKGALPGDLRFDDTIFVDISRNAFTGTIPASIWSGASSLHTLKMGRNSFEGRISMPDERSDDGGVRFPRLRELGLNDAGISGPVPFQVRLDMPRLRHIDVSHNALTGTLDWLWRVGNSTNTLKYVDVSSNAFEGKIPRLREIGARLFKFRALFNKFTGPAPAVHEKYSSYLKFLDVSNNMLSGAIRLYRALIAQKILPSAGRSPSEPFAWTTPISARGIKAVRPSRAPCASFRLATTISMEACMMAWKRWYARAPI